ncbi:MAG: glucose-1-phosphate adenylyltransferase [Elusimicrobia bacterium]|nr:glucose-1-phosphate adenylyltransferase [Elusimicrobiota bacterium]
MRKILAIVFAGGHAEEMSVLTFKRPKSAVSFGGGYRMIDFALTNLSNTHSVKNVGVLTQYRPFSLVDHIGLGMAWDFIGSSRSIRILPPHLKFSDSEWYRGTADALFQNMDFLNLHKPDDVLIVSGDHAYNMSYEPLLRFHMEHGADVTMAVTPVEKDPSRFGIVEINAEGRIISYMEKPEYPKTNLASMTVYVFKREVLEEELKRHAQNKTPSKSFHIYDDILPGLIERRKAFGWVHHGRWDYARTLDSYFKAHQDMLGDNPKADIIPWNVRTNPWSKSAPFRAVSRYRESSVVRDSIICGGCDIAGTVERSVLSPGVKVGKGAIVRDSVLWDGVIVEDGAVVDKAICDKRCVISKGAVVGYGEETPPNKELPRSLTCGATVLGMDVLVPEGVHIGRNCIVYPNAQASHFDSPEIPSGSTVKVSIQ